MSHFQTIVYLICAAVVMRNLIVNKGKPELLTRHGMLCLGVVIGSIIWSICFACDV